jgi:O-antigen/teichoic acid export membrane protein
MSSLKKKCLKGLFWDLTGNIGLQGAGFIVSIILARLLAPADFGLLAIIMVFITLAGAFLDLGFSTALIQHREVQETHYASVFYMNVSLGVVLAVLVFFSAPFIAAFYGNPQLTNLTRFMSLSFIVNSFGNVPRARLRREMNFKAISVTNIFAAIISGTGAICLAWNGYGVWSLAIQSITNGFLANAFLHFFYRQRFSLRFSFQSLKELWSFGSRMAFSGIIDLLFNNADSLLIGKLLNMSTLGFYYRAKSLEQFSMRYTASTIGSILLPGLSSLQEHPAKLKQAVTKVFHMLAFISFLVCGLLLVNGREIIILLFSAKWEPTVIMFQILISCAFASQIFNLFYNTLLSTGNVKLFLRINLLDKTLSSLNFAILFLFGINQYLAIYAVIKIITLFFGMFYVTKVLNFGNVLYWQSMKYLLIYCTSVVLVFTLQQAYAPATIYQCFFLKALLFLSSFIFMAYMAKCDGMKLLEKELRDLFRNRGW